MNSYPIFGIIAFLLFAYCSPTQGYKFIIVEAEFENGDKYSIDSRSRKLATLFKSSESDDTYEIEETTSYENGESETSSKAKFKIEGVDTMIGKDVVLRTGDNLYLRMELISPLDSRRLFSMTTLSKLGGPLNSYNLSAVYEYSKGHILGNVLISEFKYSTTGVPQRRLVIHSGEALSSEFEPHLLWTDQEFNYSASTDTMILILRPKPANEECRYYFVKFQKSTDLDKWMYGPGRGHNHHIPWEPKHVEDFFRRFA